MSEINTSYETGEEDCHVADQYLQLVETTNYNLHTDSEVAMQIGAALGNSVAMERPKESILTLGETKPFNATQAKAVDLYHAPGADASTGAMHATDRVVEVANEEQDDSKVNKAMHVALTKILSGGVTMTADLASNAIDAFKHYGKMAKEIKADLSKFKQQIQKDPEYHTTETVFQYGAYSRFFQASGRHINAYGEFSTVFFSLSKALNFALNSGAPLADSNCRLLIQTLGRMQQAKGPLDAFDMECVMDHLRDDHLDVWQNAAADMNVQEANRMFKPTVPSSLGSGSKTRGPIVSLFDNHFLVWTAPLEFDSSTSADKLRADFFGAVMERDKKLDQKFANGEAYMVLPDNEALLILIDEAIMMLSTVEKYVEFGERIKKHKSVVEGQLKALNAVMLSNTNEGNLSFKDYMPLILSIFRSFTAPHIKLMWQATRACMLLASIADTRLVQDPAKRNYARVVEKTTDKVIATIDADSEPDQVAVKEMGYFNSLLQKLKVL